MAAPLELQIAPIRELVQGRRFAEALRALDALPAAHAEEAEALYEYRPDLPVRKRERIRP